MVISTTIRKVEDPGRTWDAARRKLDATVVDDDLIRDIAVAIEPLIDYRLTLVAEDSLAERYRQVREILRDDLRACEAYVRDPASAGTIDGQPAVEKTPDGYIFRGRSIDIDDAPGTAEDARGPLWRIDRLANSGILSASPYW